MNGHRTMVRGTAAAAAVLAAVTVPAVAGVPARAADRTGRGADRPAGTAVGTAAGTGLRITRFLGERRLPHLMKFKGTTVGGLSGIDRDPRTGTWYMISDDRWRYDPARFYTGRVDIDRRTGRFTGVKVTGAHTLTGPDGKPYPGFGKPRSVDPESIRYDPRRHRVLWGNEGDRPDETHTVPLAPLTVQWAGRDGRYRGRLHLPKDLRLTTGHHGPRRNYGMEGLAIAPHVIAGMIEGPRYEDGAPPTVEHGAMTRLTLWNRSGKVRAQYAYPVDRLPTAPVPAGGVADSGVSEILAIDDHRYLALERSWLQGVGYKVKLYEFDTRGATNVLSRDSLAKGGKYRTVRKRLVADLDRYASPTQNLEGMGWGPKLKSGERTLVICSDDNFDAQEVTEFLAFAVRGR